MSGHGDEFALTAPGAPSAQHIVAQLRQAGMSVDVLAQALLVSRAQVYAWVDGAHPGEYTMTRLGVLQALFAGPTPAFGHPGLLRYVLRSWKCNGPASLHGALVAPCIDPGAVLAAVRALEPSALRAMQRDAEAEPQRDASPAAHLSEYLVAVL